MKITKVEEQGIRLIITLARSGEQMTLPELAKVEQLSEALVAKVMGQLRRGGLVDAIRGRAGGYELKQPPEKITVTMVLRALGKAPLQACYNNGYEGTDGDPCPHVSDCGLRPVWEYVGERITEALDSVTIADVIKKERSVRTVMRKLRGNGLEFAPNPEIGPNPEIRAESEIGPNPEIRAESEIGPNLKIGAESES